MIALDVPTNAPTGSALDFERNGQTLSIIGMRRPVSVAATQNSGNGLADSFETVAANLDASGAAFTYAGGDLVGISYANGVVKTLAYGPDGLASVTLSGTVPGGIALTKTFAYNLGQLISFSYF